MYILKSIKTTCLILKIQARYIRGLVTQKEKWSLSICFVLNHESIKMLFTFCMYYPDGKSLFVFLTLHKYNHSKGSVNFLLFMLILHTSKL